MKPHTYPKGVKVSTGEITHALQGEQMFIAAALERLASFRLLYTDTSEKHYGQFRFTKRDSRLWTVTPLGREALKLCSTVA